ncbi:MAG: FtsX-like permease family protein [Bacteroidetes bacterium]|nr:FtsX-like permease family protein [Bacteroidota bacterium]
MQFPLFTARRLALGRGSFSALIIRLGIAAVSVSIAVMILAIGIMQGYKREITNKITGFNAHLLINAMDFNESFEAHPIPNNEPYRELLNQNPEVLNTQGFIQKAGIIKTDEFIEGIILKGIGPDYDEHFLEQTLVKGRLPVLSDSIASNEVALSRYTANKLKLDTGQKVTVIFIQQDKQPVRIRRYTITGIFETGLDNYDKTYGIVDLRQLRRLYGWKDNEVEGIEVRIKDFSRIDEVSTNLAAIVPPVYNVRNARELRPQIFDWLSLLDTNVVIILTLMILVAAINIVTALLILILERTNMIGILKALGSRDKQIRQIFIWKAGYLILLGLLYGNIAGLGLGLIQKYTGLITLDPASYYLKQVPFDIDLLPMLAINAGTFLFCLLVLLLPARIISGISPVKAIKFD